MRELVTKVIARIHSCSNDFSRKDCVVPKNIHYFGGKSHSHPRLVKQRQLKLNKDEKGKVEIVSVSVLSKVLSLD